MDMLQICLAMIVKNEERIIERCLRSILPQVDRWVVVDTGSSDRTREIVLETMDGIPGELHEIEWQGFGHAKSTALRHATQLMGGQGYAFVLDADEIVHGSLKPETGLVEAAYSVWLENGSFRYRNVRLLRLDRAWTFRGVLHEFPSSEDPWNAVDLSVTITSPRDGARAREPERYRKDAEVLRVAMTEEGDEGLRTRYAFYLAQSLRDAGEDAEAFACYQRRADMGTGLNWEEVYISLLESARCLERMGSSKEAEKMYLRAHHQWPNRAEALRALRGLMSDKLRAAEVAQPVGGLFVEIAGPSLDDLEMDAGLRSRHRKFFDRSVQEAERLADAYRSEYERWDVERSYNGWFESGDLETYYAMVRDLRPRQIVEIGSGHATHAAREACLRNGGGARIVCVDPQPRTSLPEGVELVRTRVEDVGPSVVDDLRANDLLFIDSSHAAREALFHCSLLDRLRAGVVVHHHDFLFPHPTRFAEERLIANYYDLRRSMWEGVLSNALAREVLGPERYGELIPSYRRNMTRYPGSIYTRKIIDDARTS